MMEYKNPSLKLKPRLVIHGGAGNIRPEHFPPETYHEYRTALLSILSATNAFMSGSGDDGKKDDDGNPSALAIATHAVVQLEDNPLFNSGRGAVFTRDGINELEASVMVSRGRAKRAVGVLGLRRVRNPIVLARRVLEHGDTDLSPSSTSSMPTPTGSADGGLNVPSAQGHTLIYGQAAEQLAEKYGVETVDPSYFFTQKRWDDHIRGLEREKRRGSSDSGNSGSCSWSPDEFLPQGTCGAVAMDSEGVICVATSTGGLTNKLTGRVGDTPVPGAGYWAEEWTEDDETGQGFWDRALAAVSGTRSPFATLTAPLSGLLADCLPTPYLYSPLTPGTTTTTRSMGASGTGNGDSFLRTAAARTVASIARWKPSSTSLALAQVAGPGGELQRSAGGRWGLTGEGEGGMIGIESVVVRDIEGRVVDVSAEVVMDFNCGGMYRGWIDDGGNPVMSIWTNHGPDEGR